MWHSTNGWMKLGCAQLNRHQDHEALEAFNQALKHAPDRADIWRAKAFTLNRLNRREDALQAAERAIELDPNNPLAYQSKSIALSALGRYTEALDAMIEAHHLAPDALPGIWETVF